MDLMIMIFQQAHPFGDGAKGVIIESKYAKIDTLADAPATFCIPQAGTS